MEFRSQKISLSPHKSMIIYRDLEVCYTLIGSLFINNFTEICLKLQEKSLMPLLPT